jgi:hypothetical protein
MYQENLTIGKSLKVIGSGANTTIIDGGGVKSVFTISTGVTVTLTRVTIQHGSAQQSGGGIYNRGVLTISTSTIRGNEAGGSCSHSCHSSGGAIYNSGVLTISTSTIRGNEAVDGTFVRRCSYGCSPSAGGIFNLGTLTIINSTIAGNSAIANCVSGCGAGGGGIVNGTNATLTMNNSTLSGNVAEARCAFVPPLLSCLAVGGGIDTGGTLIINNSTVSGNAAYPTRAGGVPQDLGDEIFGGATLQNSIVANGPSGANCSGGPMTSKGYNLSSDNSCNFNGPGDMNNIDPKLGPLQNNGGPTQTQALLSGSPAIDAGNPSGCRDSNGSLLKTDQRGMPRPNPEDTGGCDMGAYERQQD